jgi:thymidylate synthase
MESQLITCIKGRNFPETWEKSLKICWQDGKRVKTDYDKKEDPPSRDITAMMVVERPHSEPMYHRAAFPMGINDLNDYIDEVVDGTRDHLAEKLGYTYHDRMANFRDNLEEDNGINQFDYVVNELKRSGYSRRAQMVIWNPKVDTVSGGEDVPCLQRLWFRIIDGKLNMNIHMRSNDLFKATFSNMIAFYNIQQLIADKLDVPVGTYCHIADSLHIYGSYFEEVEQTLSSFEDRSWSERTWSSKEIEVLI